MIWEKLALCCGGMTENDYLSTHFKPKAAYGVGLQGMIL